jgi:hypothetical protein
MRDKAATKVTTGPKTFRANEEMKKFREGEGTFIEYSGYYKNPV